jgi:hypothetical protein
MPRVCECCTHERCESIDSYLVLGTPLPELVALFRVSQDSLSHIARQLIVQKADVVRALSEQPDSEKRGVGALTSPGGPNTILG